MAYRIRYSTQNRSRRRIKRIIPPRRRRRRHRLRHGRFDRLQATLTIVRSQNHSFRVSFSLSFKRQTLLLIFSQSL